MTTSPETETAITRLSGVDDQPLPPDPQFARRDWHDLTGVWSFAHDDADLGLAEGWQAVDRAWEQTITVPYPPESAMSGIGDTAFHRVIWYSRRAAVEVAPGHRAVLHFGAVDYRCTVWCNGSRVVDHEGGMTPFAADITDALADGPEQVITVRVEDDPTDVAQPRGKQDWRSETQGIFYERTSGIWQPVWWEEVDPRHLTELVWRPDLSRSGVEVELDTTRIPTGATARIRLSVDGEEIVTAELGLDAGPQSTTGWLHIPGLSHAMGRRRLLWSVENPVLIDAHVELIVDGTVVDTVESYLGLRTCGTRDGHFLLNGHPVVLRMVLEQGYWPDSHLTAPDEDARRREVELIKELGFNGARIHQKVEDPRFLYWCDRLGLLVWGEMANAFVYTRQAAQRLVTEWLEVVRRDRSRPSIVAWIPINESWGVPDIATDPAQQHFATSMYHLTKALDPTRPTVSNEGWEYTVSDLWGIHDYTPRGDSIRQRYGDPESLRRTLTDRGPGRRRVLLGEPDAQGQPIMITEFGGLSYVPAGGGKWFGYSTITSTEEFAERLDDLIAAICEVPDLVGFCYTQFTDTLQENNGLLYADRTPKLPVEQIRAIVTRPSASLPSEEIDAYRRAAQAGTSPESDAGVVRSLRNGARAGRR